MITGLLVGDMAIVAHAYGLFFNEDFISDMFEPIFWRLLVEKFILILNIA